MTMKFLTAALALVCLASVDANDSVASTTGNCMQHNWREVGGNKHDLVCRAKEVYITNIAAEYAGSCKQGENVTITLVGDVHFNAERWDPGWYVSTDGGDALEGTCAVVSLSKGTDYTTTGGGEVRWDKDEGTDSNSAGDACGDVLIKGGKGTDLVQTEILKDTSIMCNDLDGNSKLDVAVCFSWRVKGKDAPCFPKALYPGTTAKCYCETYTIENMDVNHYSDDALPDDDAFLNDWEWPVWEPDAEEFFSEDYIEGEIRGGEKNCLNDANWDEFVSDVECAASDVTIADISTTSQSKTCIAGENVTTSLYADITFSGSRHDLAWYIGSDGGDALTGNCYATTLPPFPNPDDPAEQYYFTNGGYMTNYGNDECADVNVDSGESTLKGAEIMYAASVLCEDSDNDGFLDVSICFAWGNTESSVYCDPMFPNIGGYDQCDCERVNIEEIAVIAPVAADVVPAC